MAKGSPMSATQVAQTKRTHVQVLGKAFAILECLNRRNGATAGAIAVATSLPRGTVFRIAETLVRERMLTRDDASGGYWLASRVLGLSRAYVQERWVPAVQPVIKALEERLMWPVNVSTPDGNWMEIRCATDPSNVFVYRGLSVGRRFPMLLDGLPNLLIGYRTLREQRSALQSLYREFQPGAEYKQWEAEMLSHLEEMRRSGWRASSSSKSHALSVPLIVNKAPFGLLTMWTFPRSTTLARMRNSSLQPMMEAKVELEQILSLHAEPGGAARFSSNPSDVAGPGPAASA